MPNLFTRDDTFLGVCQGLGEDLRIPPDLIRIGLALALFFDWRATLIGYAVAGVVVFLTRRFFPVRRAAAPASAATPALPAAGNDGASAELPLAA